jgi:hypothetical protein
VPSIESVAVGKEKAGPIPHIILLFEGDKNAEYRMSPNPFCLEVPVT